MDKKQSPNLDELLNKVKASQSSVSSQEMMEWIGSQEVLPLNKARNNLKNITMITTSIIALGLLIGGFWPVQKAKEPTVSAVQTPAKEIKSTPTKVLPIERHLTQAPRQPNYPFGSVAFVSPLDTPKIDSGKKNIRVIKEIEVGNGERMELEIIMGTGDQENLPAYSGTCTPVLGPCTPITGVLELPTEALKNLGIVSGGGTLLSHQTNTDKGEIKLILDSLQVKSHMIIRRDLSKGVVIYPLLVANCGMHHMVDFDPEYEAHSSGWLAIKVPVEGSSRYYYFWFERNKEVLALLPEEVRTALSKDKTLYSLPYVSPEPIVTEPVLTGESLPQVKIFWEPEEQLVDMRPHLKVLGIEENEGGFKLKRREGVSILHGKNGVNIDITNAFKADGQRKEDDPKNLVPLFITHDWFIRGLNPHIISLIHTQGAREEEVFAFEKYRLIGLKLEAKSGMNFIFWYPYSPALKTLLTPVQQAMAEAKLAKIDKDILLEAERPVFKDVEEILIEEQPSTEALNSLSPGAEVLGNMGIRVLSDGHISLTQKMDNGRYLTEVLGKDGTRIEESDIHEVPEEVQKNLAIINHALVFVTDDLGVTPRMKMVNGGEELDLNRLIPVMVRSGLTYTLHDKINNHWRPDIIVWLKPTQEVLAILSEQGKGAEIGFIQSNEIPDTLYTEKTECSYTELCRNKVAVFSQASIFPNPALGTSTFAWESEENALCGIRLYALNGKEVRVYSEIRASKGKNAYSMDLAGLSPGIYMVILKGDKGDEIHQRLVIKQ